MRREILKGWDVNKGGMEKGELDVSAIKPSSGALVERCVRFDMLRATEHRLLQSPYLYPPKALKR